MNLKTAFLDSIANCQGFEQDAFVAAHQQQPVVSIRINPTKIHSHAVVVEESNIKTTVPWCDGAYVLHERPSFTLDPLFHAGAYYVQEASSMFLQQVVKQLFGNDRARKALDLCAAPGGKSTLLASMQQFGLIVSNEIIQSRVSILQENIIKWGGMHVLVSHNDPNDFKELPDFFDFVVVDAPCSGSGLFRKDVKAMEEWNPELVDFCAARQKRILMAAAASLAEGGYLFYSTCSFSEAENEANLDFLLDTGMFEPVAISLENEWNIIHSISDKHQASGYRFYPDKISGEGFFCGVVRKIASKDAYAPTKMISPKPVVPKAEIADWIQHVNAYYFFQKAEELFAFDAAFATELTLLSSILKLRKSGLRLGEFIRNEFIPNHELAMSTIQHSSIPVIHVDRQQALQFLRRETPLVDTVSNGWALVQYKNISLGWVKQVQGKAKNHYPLNWRILMRG